MFANVWPKLVLPSRVQGVVFFYVYGIPPHQRRGWHLGCQKELLLQPSIMASDELVY